MTSCDPNDLLAASPCMDCVPTELVPSVITYLLCLWTAKTGSGPSPLQDVLGNIIYDVKGNEIIPVQ